MSDCGCPAEAYRRLEDLIHNELCSEEAADIRAHLETCSSCSTEHNVGVVLREVISRSCREQAPETLRAQVLDGLRGLQADHDPQRATPRQEAQASS